MIILGILVLIISILMIVPLGSASLGTFKKDLCISLIQNCDNCTYVNVTSVLFPNGTLRYINTSMTENANDYNYTFCDTSGLGEYTYTTCGNLDGLLTCESIKFYITPTGTSLSTGQSIIYLIFLIASICCFMLCLYYSIKIKWKHERDEDGFIIKVNDLRYLKILLIGFCYILLVSISGLLRGITANFIPEIGVYGLFEWIYWILFAGLYPVIICSATFALMAFLSNKKLNRSLLRGIPTE